jgi:peptidoglycan/LPS O-acetylase OafA/YrhL
VTREAPYANAMNGSLWTLKSELACYLLVLALAVTTLLGRARWVVAALGAGLLAVIVWDTAHDAAGPGPIAPVAAVHIPILGWFQLYYLVVFGLAFVLGMIADVYRSSIPVNDALGVASSVLAAASLWLGWPLFGPFLVAYVYALLWAGVRLPPVLRRIGRRNDYSYGVYIYAFPIQQALSILGAPRLGWLSYVLMSVATVLVVAVCSWHLVEKPMLQLKHWPPQIESEKADTAPATEDLKPA